MPLLVDDLKDNKLYRKQIFLPSDPKNKRKHSAIFLMTPNYASSIKTMNNPFFINNGRYESYYTEKDITFILSEDHKLLENSDDICITEATISQCTRITCTTVEELNKYGIPHDDSLTAFTAYIFIDYNDILNGYIIMTEYNTRIYDVGAISYKMKRDLIEFAILLFNPKTVKVRSNADRKLYAKYGFKNVNYTDDKLNIMVHETGALNESLATAKIDIEIALWKTQIKITETIIKNFGDDNWMSHMYKDVKRKLVKIPLKGYAESADDTIDRWRDKLQDQKATLDFYLAIKEIDAKEMFDISDIMQEYVDWVDSLSCPKALKLKVINEVIDSYKKSIKEYEYNLKRYRALNDAQKRVENVAAIASKIFSIFSWVNATPIGIIRGKLLSAILPKSQKKAVLSEAELEAKIELYTKIVETLEEKKKEVEALDEYSFIELVNDMAYEYNIPFTMVTETKKYKRAAGESKDLAKARQFVSDVKSLADEYNIPVFVVTNGASGYSNNGCEAVKHARDSHIEWEKSHGADPYEDWSDRVKNESVILETVSAEDTIKRIDGYISHKQMKDDIYLVKRTRHYADDGKDHKENWLYALTPDNKLAAEMLLYNNNTEMYSLVTKKKYRNQGYATKLIACAVNDLGAKLLSITKANENGPAHKLYLKLGFKEYDRGKDYIYLRIDHRISESTILSEKSVIPTKSADKKGAYCAFPTNKSHGKTMDEDCTDRTIEHAINNFLQTKYPDHEDKSKCYIFALDSNNTLHCIGQVRIESDNPIKYPWIEKIPIPKDFVMYESTILTEAGKPAYSFPYTRKEILDIYGKDTYDRLMKDPAHVFRADTGIELIHKEPSLDELKRIKRNWDMMSDPNKKKSDDMSKKLFGKTNEEHYAELLSLYESTILNETFLFSKNNLYINFDKFENGSSNICFVTGLSGSGKSTEAQKLAKKYNAEWVEMDVFEHCGGFSEDSLKEAGMVFYDYLSAHKELWDRLKKKEIKGKELGDEIKKFVKYCVSWCKSHKDKKWIIEGVQIYSFLDANKMKNEPILFVNASMLKSIFQRFKRNGDGKIEWKKELTNEFPQMLKWYIDNEKDFTAFKKAVLSEDTILEGKLSSKDRKDLPDSAFGIPSERRYPMPDTSHVKAAVRMFNHVEPENEKILANNIKRKIKEFNLEDDITVSNDNRFSKYYKGRVHEGYFAPYIEEEAVLTALALQTEDSITFLEGNDEVLVEADTAYNATLRRVLYSERIKNHKEIMLLYDQVKQDCPYIKYTFVDYDRYSGRNLFIDWSYYTKAFFKNNIRKYDKAVDLYFEFVNRFLEDKRLTSLGYGKKTVLIPVDDWIPDKDKEYWNYREHLNPISIIYRLVFRDLEKLQSNWGDYTFIFTGRNGYFKMDFSKFQKKDLPRFLQNIKTLVVNLPVPDDTDEPDNSTAGIVNLVVDRIEANSDIKINNLTGATKATPEEIKDRIDNAAASSDDATKTPEEKLVDAIAATAAQSKDDEEVVQKMDNDEYIKQLVIDLRNSSADNVSIEPTRAARMRKLNDQFTKKTINNKTIAELLTDTNDNPLPEIALPIDSINDDWKHMKFVNHGKEYNLDADIIRCIHHFAQTTVPVSILDFNVEDTSTSEDWVETWTVKCEDSYGKRFTLKFDIPKLKNDRTMKLRGNDKTINGQLMNLPIIKTEQDTCQMTSNYNKIFFSGYGTSTGKSYVVADRIIKTLNKMESSSDFKIDFGDNRRICSKYELPMDYIDIASVISKITYFNRHVKVRYTLFFNQDELYEKYGKLITDKDALPIGIMESDSFKGVKILYAKGDIPVSFFIYDILFPYENFANTYATTNTSVRYTYSKASILNTDIPVAVIIGYYIGLIPMLDRAGIQYTVSDKRPKYDKNTQDIIRLSDAFIVYDLDYDSSMLLNGLKQCDTAAYSLKEVNSKKMWVEFLDNFGGRLKADGLDMFYDLMFDPITKIVCEKYELPTDFIDALLYANMLMSDNKYNKHTDIRGNRYRTTEIIAGYTYKALCNSYTQYRRDIRAGRDAKMTMKQSAVIDLLFADSTFGDLSSLSDLLEYESLSSTSFKGLSGMNSDRAYGLDKRTFDESMINVLALSTGFASNAGINRQSTIDMSIDSTRGYIKNNDSSNMSVTKTFCMTEALTPFGATSDDPFRSAMTFIQTSKHEMRTKISDPLLVTNGADEALPYLTSNTFTYKAKAAGKVKEKTDDYMIVEYKDGSTEVIDLRERILKNSDGGMYIVLQLSSDLKEGNIFSSNEIIAYDKTSYTAGVGPADSFAYDIGTFVKFANINSDEGFEDSCIETEWIADAMASTVVVNKEYTLPKDTNVYFIAKKGQPIQEGEPLLIFQNAFDEEDANALIKALSGDEDDDIAVELGRIPIYSKVTGVVKDIKILRTVEVDELSPSLKKIVTDYEKEVKKFNKILEKYDPEKAKVADATYKLEPTGKLKNASDAVRIEFSLAYEDKFSVGDKTVCFSALKGVSKGKIPKGLEPYSQYRPDEKIHYIQSTTGNMKRMVGSILKVGAINKVMVELARQSCDIMGIKWKYFDEYDS